MTVYMTTAGERMKLTISRSTLKGSLRCNESGKHVGIELVASLVPIQLFAEKLQSVFGQDAYPPTKFPQLLLVVVIGGISLNVGLHMELLVELGHEDTLVHNPTRRVHILIHFPALGNNTVLDNA